MGDALVLRVSWIDEGRFRAELVAELSGLLGLGRGEVAVPHVAYWRSVDVRAAGRSSRLRESLACGTTPQADARIILALEDADDCDLARTAEMFAADQNAGSASLCEVPPLLAALRTSGASHVRNLLANMLESSLRAVGRGIPTIAIDEVSAAESAATLKRLNAGGLGLAGPVKLTGPGQRVLLDAIGETSVMQLAAVRREYASLAVASTVVLRRDPAALDKLVLSSLPQGMLRDIVLGRLRTCARADLPSLAPTSALARNLARKLFSAQRFLFRPADEEAFTQVLANISAAGARDLRLAFCRQYGCTLQQFLCNQIPDGEFRQFMLAFALADDAVEGALPEGGDAGASPSPRPKRLANAAVRATRLWRSSSSGSRDVSEWVQVVGACSAADLHSTAAFLWRHGVSLDKLVRSTFDGPPAALLLARLRWAEEEERKRANSALLAPAGRLVRNPADVSAEAVLRSWAVALAAAGEGGRLLLEKYQKEHNVQWEEDVAVAAPREGRVRELCLRLGQRARRPDIPAAKPPSLNASRAMVVAERLSTDHDAGQSNARKSGTPRGSKACKGAFRDDREAEVVAIAGSANDEGLLEIESALYHLHGARNLGSARDDPLLASCVAARACAPIVGLVLNARVRAALQARVESLTGDVLAALREKRFGEAWLVAIFERLGSVPGYMLSLISREVQFRARHGLVEVLQTELPAGRAAQLLVQILRISCSPSTRSIGRPCTVVVDEVKALETAVGLNRLLSTKRMDIAREEMEEVVGSCSEMQLAAISRHLEALGAMPLHALATSMLPLQEPNADEARHRDLLRRRCEIAQSQELPPLPAVTRSVSLSAEALRRALRGNLFGVKDRTSAAQQIARCDSAEAMALRWAYARAFRMSVLEDVGKVFGGTAGKLLQSWLSPLDASQEGSAHEGEVEVEASDAFIELLQRMRRRPLDPEKLAPAISELFATLSPRGLLAALQQIDAAGGKLDTLIDVAFFAKDDVVLRAALRSRAAWVQVGAPKSPSWHPTAQPAALDLPPPPCDPLPPRGPSSWDALVLAVGLGSKSREILCEAQWCPQVSSESPEPKDRIKAQLLDALTPTASTSDSGRAPCASLDLLATRPTEIRTLALLVAAVLEEELPLLTSAFTERFGGGTSIAAFLKRVLTPSTASLLLSRLSMGALPLDPLHATEAAAAIKHAVADLQRSTSQDLAHLLRLLHPTSHKHLACLAKAYRFVHGGESLKDALRPALRRCNGEAWAILEMMLDSTSELASFPPAEYCSPRAAREATILRSARGGIVLGADLHAYVGILAVADVAHMQALRFQYARKFKEALGTTLKAQIPEGPLRDLLVAVVEPSAVGCLSRDTIDAAAAALNAATTGEVLRIDPFVKIFRESDVQRLCLIVSAHERRYGATLEEAVRDATYQGSDNRMCDAVRAMLIDRMVWARSTAPRSPSHVPSFLGQTVAPALPGFVTIARLSFRDAPDASGSAGAARLRLGDLLRSAESVGAPLPTEIAALPILSTLDVSLLQGGFLLPTRLDPPIEVDESDRNAATPAAAKKNRAPTSCLSPASPSPTGRPLARKSFGRQSAQVQEPSPSPLIRGAICRPQDNDARTAVFFAEAGADLLRGDNNCSKETRASPRRAKGIGALCSGAVLQNPSHGSGGGHMQKVSAAPSSPCRANKSRCHQETPGRLTLANGSSPHCTATSDARIARGGVAWVAGASPMSNCAPGQDSRIESTGAATASSDDTANLLPDEAPHKARLQGVALEKRATPVQIDIPKQSNRSSLRHIAATNAKRVAIPSAVAPQTPWPRREPGRRSVNPQSQTIGAREALRGEIAASAASLKHSEDICARLQESVNQAEVLHTSSIASLQSSALEEEAQSHPMSAVAIRRAPKTGSRPTGHSRIPGASPLLAPPITCSGRNASPALRASLAAAAATSIEAKDKLAAAIDLARHAVAVQQQAELDLASAANGDLGPMSPSLLLEMAAVLREAAAECRAVLRAGARVHADARSQLAVAVAAISQAATVNHADR